MNDTPSNHRWILAFGLTLAVAVQLTVISGTWYLDSDDWFIIDMGRQVVTAPAVDQFTRFWSEEPTWRPLLTARTAVEYALFGDLAGPRIVVNLVLHVLCALLLFLTVRTWFGRPEAAAWTAVLFAVHPLHAEALTWFHSGFEGITPTLFVLLTVWLFVSRRPLALGLLAFQLAIFTRENSLFLPLLLGAAAAARAPKSDRLKRAFTDASPYVALLVANVALRLVMIHFAGGESTSDFHMVDNPLAAILTTALHPWIPIHPALSLRLTWWVTFAAVPLILIWVQWDMDRRELKTAFVAFFIATLPFLPVFHAGHRFLEALPGGYEQRWYFFHLPLAFLMIWPAYLIVDRDYRRTGFGALALVALFGLMLTAQGFNARWYRQQADVSSQVAQTVTHAIAESAPAVGVVINAGLDSSELADQVFLNVARIWPDSTEKGIRSFHLYKEPGESVAKLQESAPGLNGHRHWTAVTDLPPFVRWWVWNPATESMDPILPKDLDLPPGAVLPSCCAH